LSHHGSDQRRQEKNTEVLLFGVHENNIDQWNVNLTDSIDFATRRNTLINM
jgi:hypothetical protein